MAQIMNSFCQIQTEIEESRYDLNQIPYDYTVEVRNRFKGLDLKERVPDELWMEVRDIVQEVRDIDQDHPQEKEMQKSKMAV